MVRLAARRAVPGKGNVVEPGTQHLRTHGVKENSLVKERRV